MDEVGKVILYGGSVATGAALYILGILHRGTEKPSSARFVNISDGNGLSSKIIKFYPNYRHLSPIVDHLVAGIGATAAVGGALGLAQVSIDKLYQFFYRNAMIKTDEILPFLAAGAGWAMLEIYRDAEISKKRRMTINDILQHVAFIAGSSATVYAIYQIVR